MSDYEENLSGNTSLEYEVLRDRIRWYFECIDAMSTVHRLLLSSKYRQTKRYGAYRRLAIMAGEAESALRELVGKT